MATNKQKLQRPKADKATIKRLLSYITKEFAKVLE